MARSGPRGRSRHRGSAVRRPGQRRLCALPHQTVLPGPRRRKGMPMTATTPMAAPRFTPAELAAALGLPQPTDEQTAVISAPLGPMVVIAGAGAGKTETMAARVVW